MVWVGVEIRIRNSAIAEGVTLPRMSTRRRGTAEGVGLCDKVRNQNRARGLGPEMASTVVRIWD